VALLVQEQQLVLVFLLLALRLQHARAGAAMEISSSICC
jgi:hypothetical protein